MSSITSPGIQRVPTDSGTAIPVGGALAIVGAGGITTSASGDTVTITGGGGGGGISTIDGDSGSATGSTITFNAAYPLAGATASFSATGSTVNLNLTSGVNSTILGANSKTPSGSNRGNTGLGYNIFNTGGSSSFNCVLGAEAYKTATSGGNNVAIGYAAMGNANTVGNCIAIGTQALFNASSLGSNNIAIGGSAGSLIDSGINNLVMSQNAASYLTSGNQNIAIGYNAFTDNFGMSGLSTGSNNIGIGYQVGLNYLNAESNNILIGQVYGATGESSVTRIGNSGSGTPQSACYIEGIAGVSVSNTQMVTINSSTGQLGSQSIPSGLQTWSVITANQSAVKNNGYFCNKSGSVCEVLLPATSAVGDTFTVVAMNSDGWRVTQGSGQQIFFGAGSTTLGATGYLAFNAVGDTATLVCRVANTTWQVVTNIGNITPS